MLEVAIPSIWASVHGWLTPIDGCGDPRKPFRSPSLVLDRLRSFNLNRYRSGDIPIETDPHSEPLETLHALPDPAVAAESEATEAFHDLEAHPASEENNKFSRTQSDTHPTAGEAPVKLAAKMKKSASDKSAFAHFEAEEAEVVRWPATMKTRTGQREAEEEEYEGEEVDARAADFINRFRQPLKLQRLDSSMRCMEMLNRGALEIKFRRYR